MSTFNTAVPNRFVSENLFLTMEAEKAGVPEFGSSKRLLPAPFWSGHQEAIDCYWKSWELAFGNLRQPPSGSPLIANFIDTAFNDATFMWDSSFMSMFGRYGHRVFCFQRTLDNFYARQHKDGFISREIRVADGSEAFERYDVSSTGPNIMPWAEWEYFLNFGDRERLARVFPALVAYTQWFRKFRSWPDGTYFSSGFGCGMDNQPRLPEGFSPMFDHGHMTWIDTTFQQIFADGVLLKMAAELGRSEEVADLAEEAKYLAHYVNVHLWDDDEAFYFDRFRDGTLSNVKSIAAYWALLAGIVPGDRLSRFLAHLDNPREFKRPHRVPTLSADHPDYDHNTGGYWRGAVWSPTNYMVLRGLTQAGADAMAHEIAINHLSNVVETFNRTGTVWENYSPETPTHGAAKKDFVGWTGLSPIAILLEYAFGLRPDAAQRGLLWDVRLLEAHGVERYPLGRDTELTLRCGARHSAAEEPAIEITGNRPVTLTYRWECGEKKIEFRP